MNTFFSFTFLVAVYSAAHFVVVVVAAADPAAALTVFTPPSLKQCQEVELKWTEGTGPYNLIVVHAEDPCGDPIVDLGNFDATSAKWNVSVPAGSKIELSLADMNEDEAWSGAVTVAQSDDDSCLPGNSTLKASLGGGSTSTSTTPAILTGSGAVAPSAIGGVKNAGLTNGVVTAIRPAYSPSVVLAALLVAAFVVR